MLKRVVSVKGIGLFHDAGPSPSFNRVSLIYGENGRGKSTLASILRSCSEGQGTIIASRATLDGTIPASVNLTFELPNGQEEHPSYAGNAWTKSASQLQVFDADFVSRNVYAGAEISADQRASLLEFALGEQAVELRKKVDEAAAKLLEATTAINNQTNVLKAHAGTLGVDAFIKLQAAPDADAEIEAIEKRIAAANARDEILKKTLPTQVKAPSFDASSLFSILAKSLPEIEAAADDAVKQHIKKCAHPNFEQWLSQGSSYNTGDECPYCGTSIAENDLIKAYRTHFNKAYDELKTTASKLEGQVSQRLSDAVVDSIEHAVKTAQAQLEGWKGYVDGPQIMFDASEMKKALTTLRGMIEPLAAAKARQPLEPIGSPTDAEAASEQWKSAVSFVTSVNEAITASIDAIELYKKSLAEEDVIKLKAAVDTLKMRKLRYTTPVVAEVNQLTKLTDAKKARSEEKDATRKALDALMTQTLGAYQTEINTLLGAFGAQIRIDDLGFDYRGGAGLPRSDYQLKVRGRQVRLAGTGSASFGNTLSEGDKRALAFAFFVARAHQDPQLQERILVIDDPMCSLDRRRRAATVRVLKELAAKSKQMIILAHDPSFLQDMDDGLSKIEKVVGPRSYCKIVPTANDYSSFDDLVLSAECSNQYERDLSAITGYVNVQAGHSPDYVAKCLRVVLETSLHRQFPSYIPRNTMLGKIIDSIDKAVPTSPLTALKPHITELRALNDYASPFHHAEDNADQDLPNIDEGELRAYSDRVLKFVFRG